MFMRVAISLTAALLTFAQPALAGDLADANNAMGMDLLRRLDPGGTKNVFISPFSIWSALTLTANGARGGTLDAMRQALHLKQISLADADSQYKILDKSFNDQMLDSINDKKSLSLRIANGLFVQKTFPLNKPFLQIAQQQFAASVQNLDFSKPEAPAAINSWVSEKTERKIPTIINSLSPDMRLVVVNAVYFKAPWQDEFETVFTKPQAFHINAGTKIQIPMMHNTHSFQYWKGKDLEAVALGYMNSSLEMAILLPAKNSSVEQALKTMPPTLWDELKHRLSSQVALSLPKFKIAYSASLKTALVGMGMKEAFDPQADFSGISAGGLYISDVLHKTYLDVNEKGTEAAAATAVMLAGAMYDPKPPIPFVVDRPFIVAIFDSKTKTIVFLGVVRDPRQ